MEVTERDASAHNAVKEGSGEEVMAIGGRGGVGSHLQGIQRIWAPPGDGDLLLIPREVDLGGGQQLAGCGQKLVMGEGGVEEDDENPQQVGGVAADVRIFL